MNLKRRGFLKAAMGALVGTCLPLPAIPRAKPPVPFLRILKPGIWARVDGATVIKSIDRERRTITFETLSTQFGFTPAFDLVKPVLYLRPEVWKDMIGEN